MKTYGPYSPRRKSGNLIFISGQVAPNAGSFADEVKAVLDKIDAILKEAGSSRKHVLYVQVFVKDFSDEKFAEFNEIYTRYLEERGAQIKPARVFIGVADLPVGANVEITAVAEVALYEMRYFLSRWRYYRETSSGGTRGRPGLRRAH